MKIKIRKARKGDLKQYADLVVKSNKEYQKITGKKIRFTEKQIKKDFNEFTNFKNKIILLVVEENKCIIVYLVAFFVINSYQKIGYIDYLFIDNNYRRKGIAKDLIKEFTKILRKRKIKKIKLGVNINNDVAINFYKNLGFKTYHYDMEKIIK